MAANKQAWEDFSSVIGTIERTKSVIKEIGGSIEKLKEMKKDIMDDPERQAELKKIIDQHPDFSITSLKADFTKLIALHAWLDENGYL